MRVVKPAATVIATVFAFLLAADRSSAEWKFGGHSKYQYTYTNYHADDLNAQFGADPAADHDVDLRLKAEGQTGPWEAVAHYEMLALHGDTVTARRRTAPFLPVRDGSVTGLPDDRRRLFDLTHSLTDRSNTAIVHRFDRWYVGYGTEAHALRFGRQTLSWGNGIVFHPLDFINPFPPTAIDKDYKSGEDMLYAQTLAYDVDLQAIVVPRRDTTTHHLENEESTYAAKWRWRWKEFDLDVAAARHFGETLTGAGIVRSIGGSVWRFDALRMNESDAWSLVTNLDYSWMWSGRNTYGYLEYYRNGVGETDSARYLFQNAALASRLARGELYTLGRDYLAFGLRVEFDPLFNAFGNVIWNLNDGSRLVQLRGVYDWRQSVQLTVGVHLPFGERGDEFGGIPLPGTNAFLASGRSVYTRLAYYF